MNLTGFVVSNVAILVFKEGMHEMKEARQLNLIIFSLNYNVGN